MNFQGRHKLNLAGRLTNVIIRITQPGLRCHLHLLSTETTIIDNNPTEDLHLQSMETILIDNNPTEHLHLQSMKVITTEGNLMEGHHIHMEVIWGADILDVATGAVEVEHMVAEVGEAAGMAVDTSNSVGEYLRNPGSA